MRKLLCIGIIALAFTACKKDDDDKSCAVTTTTLAGTYYLESMVYRLPNGFEENVTANFVENCEMDDTYELEAGGTATYNDAGVECSVNGDETGTWALSGNTVTLTVGAFLGSGQVESFNCKKLVVVSTNVQTSGDKLTYTLIKL